MKARFVYPVPQVSAGYNIELARGYRCSTTAFHSKVTGVRVSTTANLGITSNACYVSLQY